MSKIDGSPASRLSLPTAGACSDCRRCDLDESESPGLEHRAKPIMAAELCICVLKVLLHCALGDAQYVSAGVCRETLTHDGEHLDLPCRERRYRRAWQPGRRQAAIDGGQHRLDE